MEDKKKLFVAQLDYSITDAQLKSFFEQVGEVLEAVVIQDRDAGRSKGFGFVTMATEELAQEAIKKLSGIAWEKRNIVVKIAKPREPRV